jgi:outer membrane protein, heavy metal efflux system
MDYGIGQKPLRMRLVEARQFPGRSAETKRPIMTMTKFRNLGLLGLVLMGMALLVRAEELNAPAVTINEPQAIALFFERNLDLIAARYNIDQARAEQLAAAAIPNPVMGLGIGELNAQMGQKRNSGKLPAVTVQLSQLIETAGKRRLRMESSEFGTEAVELDFQDVVRQVVNAVRHGYYGLLLAQKTAELAQDNLARYREILRVNGLRLQVGDIGETDFTRIEVESMKAQGDVDNAQAALIQARANLLALLGWPEHSVNLSASSWPEGPGQIIRDESENRLVSLALEQRPDLKAARVRIRQAESSLDLARRLVIPDVTVGAYFERDPGNYFNDTGGIGVSVPLPLFYKQEGEIAKAGVNVNAARLFLRQTELGIRGEVMKAVASWKSADAIARRFEETVVGRIEKLRKAQEFAYQKGAASLLELIDAERNYKAMMLDYFTALANRSNARADVAMALGEEIKP